MTFKDFLKLEGGEGSGNKRPTPQRQMHPVTSVLPAMPARGIPDHDPIQPKLKPIRAAGELFMIPKPKNTVGVIDRPSLLAKK